MKLQRYYFNYHANEHEPYTIHDNIDPENAWVKESDAEALEKRVSDLEIALGFIEEQAILLDLPGLQRQVRNVLFGERK